jgi:alkanesulfonate monooxygenase SsuD/methylene tetrahydromethanopterin reductase-like flavin-dependent oxidoreductase (luciferase family)
VKIGLALPHYDTTLERVVGVTREAEGLGFNSVWVSDHLVFDYAKYGGSPDPVGCIEPLTLLSVLAAETSRVRLGTMVLNNELRPPALVAKMAATIDLASGGRLELGLGAGWYEGDFVPFGIAMPRAGVRLARLAESVDIIKLLLTGEPVTYAGRNYSLDGAIARPAAPEIPIWVGAKGPRAIRVASRADGWNASWMQDPGAYAALPDPGVRRSIGQYARGSYQEQVDRLAGFAALGVELAVMCFGRFPFGLDDPDDLARFVQDVLPAVREL